MKLIKALKEIGIANDCYKILLDCADHNVKFYELVIDIDMMLIILV